MNILLSVYRRLLRLEFWRWKHIDYPVLGLFAVLLLWDTAAQLLFKVGLTAHGVFPMHSLEAATSYLAMLAAEPAMWLGVVTLVLAFVTWLAIIARIDLSKAHPATSFSYVTVTLASGVLLHENVSLLQFAGIVLIMLGVYLVAE